MDPSREAREALRARQPLFTGNWEQLRRLMQVLDTPRRPGHDDAGKRGSVQRRFSEIDVRGAVFDSCSTLAQADLRGADLSEATLAGACLSEADLQRARMVGTDLRASDLSRAKVFGLAAWEVLTDDRTCQSGLRVTPDGFGELTADHLEAAHLIHLLSNPDLYSVLSNVNRRGVLLLGRFKGERGAVLDALRVRLKELGFLALKFDFRRPEERTLKETVLTMAGLCKFIVADLTDARSIPLELGTIVKEYKIPVVAIQQEGHETFSMYESIDSEFRDRVLRPLEYRTREDLIAVVEEAIVQPALERAVELVREKQAPQRVRRTGDYARNPT